MFHVEHSTQGTASGPLPNCSGSLNPGCFPKGGYFTTYAYARSKVSTLHLRVAGGLLPDPWKFNGMRAGFGDNGVAELRE